MAFGILESTAALEHVPGTAQLEDAIEGHPTRLKHAKGNSEIVLVPQPSNDPNDPLNWPLWQRDLILLLYCYCTILAVGGIGPILAPLYVPLMMEFNVSFTEISLLTGYQLATVGASAIFVSALSYKYGKRPVFLVSMALLFAGVIWAALAKSYDSMLGARIIQGLGTTMFESITFAIIGDMYFVHQRGSRMAAYVTAQAGIISLPGLIAGKVTYDLDSWRWVFWISSAFFGIGLVGGILFAWETAYNRAAIYETDISSKDNLQMIEKAGPHKTNAASEPELEKMDTASSTARSANHTRHSFLKRIKPWSTTYSDTSLLNMCIRPFMVMLNPCILWAIVFIAFTQLWNVVTSLVIAQIFSPPPYLLNTAQIGYMQTGPMVLGFLTCIFCGAFSDRICIYLSKRNHGVYEPEFRLLLNGLAPIFCSGWFLFGHFTEAGVSPVAASAFWGIGFVSSMICLNAVGTYLVDAFRDTSIEIFVMSMCFKNFLFFGFSYFLNDWIAIWGPARAFYAVGGINIGFCATTILVYVFGKRCRAWWHTHRIMKHL
ncbi:major facilitator superfamily domain-containing protein [Leptodontidium sp. 2 PMI_412]|nr:major facilitator superfamily domain-containing protein [Leptodontidium sp. 2 PMI_412]